MVAHLREQAVQCGLVGHQPAQGGRAVVFADECHPGEPGRPVLVEVTLEPELVVGGRVGSSVHREPATSCLDGSARTASGRAWHPAPARGGASLGTAGRVGYRCARYPERVAETDHGDAVREGQEPVERVRQHRERDGDDTADGQERGRPAGEDARPVQRDAEEEAAAQEGEP